MNVSGLLKQQIYNGTIIDHVAGRWNAPGGVHLSVCLSIYLFVSW